MTPKTSGGKDDVDLQMFCRQEGSYDDRRRASAFDEHPRKYHEAESRGAFPLPFPIIYAGLAGSLSTSGASMAAWWASHPRHRAAPPSPKKACCRPHSHKRSPLVARRGYLRRPTGPSVSFRVQCLCDKSLRTCAYTNNSSQGSNRHASGKRSERSVSLLVPSVYSSLAAVM